MQLDQDKTYEKCDINEVRFFQSNSKNFQYIFSFVLIFHCIFGEWQIRKHAVFTDGKITRFWSVLQPKMSF